MVSNYASKFTGKGGVVLKKAAPNDRRNRAENNKSGATNLRVNPKIGLPIFRWDNLNDSIFHTLFCDTPDILHRIFKFIESGCKCRSLSETMRALPLRILLDCGFPSLDC